MSRQMMLEIAFTTFVVALILFPIPPSTIIGVALATNPKTGRYMNKTAYKVVRVTMRGAGSTIVYPAKQISTARQRSAKIRIEAGLYRL